jgi:hypothetical protein
MMRSDLLVFAGKSVPLKRKIFSAQILERLQSRQAKLVGSAICVGGTNDMLATKDQPEPKTLVQIATFTTPSTSSWPHAGFRV